MTMNEAEGRMTRRELDSFSGKYNKIEILTTSSSIYFVGSKIQIRFTDTGDVNFFAPGFSFVVPMKNIEHKEGNTGFRMKNGVIILSKVEEDERSYTSVESHWQGIKVAPVP